ncbi:MAG TPA: efflux RND transporter permease subunit, partial [Phycisphaerae bacterium]|nr:efflux RND transporter permease subunit [Phycisphaerae bacterium]
MTDDYRTPSPEQRGLLGGCLRACLTNKLVVFLFVLAVLGAGVAVAPFDWDTSPWPRSPVPTDAIPDLGENQQIVFTEWMGRSPQDVEDQISYPMTVALLGVPGVKTIRSYSMFGFSTVYVIFKENVDFYWSRSRILEKLSSLPSGTLPEGVQPALGPDATALGQIYWYTLEGRDGEGQPAGGWDLEELRTIQDWSVRYALRSADGVSEVASVGGFVREYQVDVDPDALRAHKVTLPEVYAAVKASNIDVGAKTIELNRVEYFIRGIGFIKTVDDVADSVVKVTDNVPLLVRHVATVTLGPALRRGALDKDGAEAVGGVVVARYGDNPLAVIKNVRKKIDEISAGLPAKVLIDLEQVTPALVRAYAERHGFEAYAGEKLNQEAWQKHLRGMDRKDRPAWVRLSQVTIVPFYDRAGLIYETLGTLKAALSEEILITLIVVILMVVHLRSSVLIGSMLPLSVLLCFVAMRVFGVDANIVALSGIAIAIGTIVDMGIVLSENVLRHLDQAPPEASRLEVIHRAASEVGGAVLTAVATTIVSFLPVFAMTGAEGKLFKPLAFTKTFALLGSIVVALAVIPPAAHVLFCGRISGRKLRVVLYGLLAAIGAALAGHAIARGSLLLSAAGAGLIGLALYSILADRLPPRVRKLAPWAANLLAVALVGVLLSRHWEPLGPERGDLRNLLFVAALVGVLLGLFRLVRLVYPWVLRWCLAHKAIFLSFIGAIPLFGATAWLGFGTIFGRLPDAAETVGLNQTALRSTNFWVAGSKAFPGLGKEFMPDLDEGSFLYMPTTSAHASVGEALDVLAKQDRAFRAIPEIDSVVGKIGRADTPLDPAPVSMIETVINYKPEYITGRDGRRVKFRYDDATGRFARDAGGELIPDPAGRPFRQWRDDIRTPDDIWKRIVEAGEIPGTTSAPKLQPIAARIVMLQSGMRAPMGLKVRGPSLEAIERAGLALEKALKLVPGVEPSAVVADRIVGKPYLEIVADRQALARYGVKMRRFQDIVEIAIGGRKITQTVEGRQRFAVRARYQRELRDRFETLGKILVPGTGGVQVPLSQVALVRYVRGPQVIKSEDTFLTGYVLLDKKPGQAEVDVVERCQAHLLAKIRRGELVLPPGVTYTFAGTYENQLRAQGRLKVILPLALLVIFLILYFQFRSVSTTLGVFSGIFVAWAGGFVLLWLYGQPWFLRFSVLGVDMRELFQVHPVNLSVAVWVGFLALFGIATDDGVVMGTYLTQAFRDGGAGTVVQVREAVVAAGTRRVRACLMTTATTILALLPVLTATGRGSDIMVPMAIPSFGGMLIEILTMFVVPVLFCLVQEVRLRRASEVL